MLRWARIAVGVFVFGLVVSQLLVPSFGERKIEDRLTEGGGTADVTLGAVPAARLLFGDGERFQVSAKDLDLDLRPGESVFDRLDGFSVVDVSISDSKAGPLNISRFELSRDGPGPYHLALGGQTTPADLVDYGLDNVDLPGTSLIGTIFDQFFGPSDTEVPVDMDMELTSQNGRVEVTSGGGSVGGIPTGHLAEMITSAVVVRL
jgi:hypothetical protein